MCHSSTPPLPGAGQGFASSASSDRSPRGFSLTQATVVFPCERRVCLEVLATRTVGEAVVLAGLPWAGLARCYVTDGEKKVLRIAARVNTVKTGILEVKNEKPGSEEEDSCESYSYYSSEEEA